MDDVAATVEESVTEYYGTMRSGLIAFQSVFFLFLH
jgi:hypothetical protein